MGARPGEDFRDGGGVRVRKLGNFGQHDGDDVDVQNADPWVVQVVRKGFDRRSGPRSGLSHR